MPKRGHGRYSPLGGNVEPFNGACVTRKGSYEEVGIAASDVAKNRAAVRVCGESQCSITMQITALQFSFVYMLLPIKSNLCRSTSRYTLQIKCFMLVFL